MLTIDGRKVETFSDMQRIVTVNPGQTLVFVVERDSAQVTLNAVPTLEEHRDRFGNAYRLGRLGITGIQEAPKPVSVLQATGLGAAETWFVVDRTLSYIGGVIIGRESADQLGGPLRIAQVSGQVASIGFPELLNLTAVLSVSIGLLNLFPIPLLDGPGSQGSVPATTVEVGRD